MDLYAILGLKLSASPADIKRAYRRLARKYHPDINPGDRAAEMRFRQIAEAYETLIDPERRRRYDESGAVVETPAPGTVDFEGFDFSVEAVEGSRASTFGDLFADVFQRGFQSPTDEPERGADLHARIEVSFDEAIRGADRHLTVTHLAACAGCGGSGAVRMPEARCLHCNGTGSIRSARGHMVFTRSCPQCGGTGRQRQSSCSRCGGLGVETRTESISARVPAGTADGARLRLAGKGNCGRKAGPCGDLYVTVQVLPHPLFRREGDDLFLQVPVAVHEAALGTRIDVPTLEGPARLRVPPGTQSGQRFRLRERGVPSRDGRRGDLVVEIRIVLPRLLDERSKELLREFGRINVEDVRADWLSGRRSN
jgi:molecular chaperone DnaJ